MTFKEAFNDWMSRLIKSENPPGDIIAFNFGLFETADGYTLYLSGARVFDAANDDWATAADYEPKDKYLPVNPDETREMEWAEVLALAKQVIHDFVKSEKFGNSILKKATAITTGFDDGELERVS